MAMIENLRRWRNGEVLNARDYVYERDLIVSLVNAHEAALAAMALYTELIDSIGFDGETIDRIDFDLLPAKVVTEAGQIGWNEVDGTFNGGLLNGSIGQFFQETLIYAKAQGSINVGDGVMFVSVQGNHLLVTKATQVAINANPEYFVGIATNNIANGEFGYITWFGKVNDFPAITYNFTAGDVLWFDSAGTVAGRLTKVRPPRGYAQIRVCAVIKDSQNINQPNTGIAFIRPSILEATDGVKTYLQTEEPETHIAGDIWFDTSE